MWAADAATFNSQLIASAVTKVRTIFFF